MSEDGRQIVRSPEQVVLHLPVAGPTSRILAYAIDAILLLLAQVALWVVVILGVPRISRWLLDLFHRLLAGGSAVQNATDALLVLLAGIWLTQLALELGYFVLFETANGQSVGKRALRLRVVQDGGFPITLGHALVRNLLRVVDALPGTYIVGLVSVILSSDGKRLGDLAAGTIVVRLDRPPPAPPLAGPPAETADVFRFDREQISRIGPTEVTLLLETLRRIETLDAAQAEKVLERSAAAICARIGHPPIEPREREAFLRSVLAALRLG
jgi:uncharacterized RDD family membrane protein YckC